ncbi:MFS transporter [Undibacterium jejuense]|uniref:MFS transporter n=1 Tax=Undibacterium jejuense TaxID=1344949 RepID=A0A923HH84_9BURK|nr:MFS transporter [Undibacterium jejuense]MBC3861602.1 MFS transporter [Undibacterium jejuense]
MQPQIKKEAKATATTTTTTTAKATLFSDKNFRWLIGGSTISMLGDQFTMVALPWLVLKMTGDTFILGIVLAMLGVPRALFIFIGGAIVDQYSPKRVMMITKCINTVLLATLAGLVFSGHLSLWMVYALALSLGISTAFSIPAGTSMLPRVVALSQLQIANSITLSIRQVSMFLGPVMAGILIAICGQSENAGIKDSTGLSAAFLLDCASYAISAWTLNKVITRDDAQNKSDAVSILKNVFTGLQFCWQQKELRTCFMYWSAIAFFIMGPMQIAMPLLATKLNNSAGTFGLLAGAHGAGTLLGMAVSGIKPNLRFGTLGGTMLLIDFIIALLFMPLGLVQSSWQAVLILLTIASLGGYLHVAVFTWIQTQVPPALLGRAMSMFMFIFMGIGPISAALSGWMMRSLQLTQLFFVCGAMLMLIVIFALFASPMRLVKDNRASANQAG